MKILVFNICFLVFVRISFAKIDSIKVNYENGNRCFSWTCNDCSNTINFQIFIFEGSRNSFPTQKVDIINKDASKWCFEKRIGANIFGMSIKSHTQWGKYNVLTPGESYTVGIERIYLDKTTQKEKYDSTFFNIYPYQILDIVDIKNYQKLALDDFYLHSSYSSFIVKKGEIWSFINQSESFQILSIFQNSTHYLLQLNNSKFVSVEKKPRRPEPLGNFSQIVYTISALLISIAGLISIILVYLIFKALYYLNFILNNSNDFEKIFGSIIQNEKMSPLIIYTICNVLQFDVINKIINRFLGFDLRFFKNNENMKVKIDEMSIVFSKYPIYEYSKINASLKEVFPL